MSFSQRGSVLSLGDSGVSDDNYGSVALSRDGNVLAVGAWGRDNGGRFQDGSVYVYDRSDTSWTLRATVTAADAASNDNFGYAVALNSDGTVLVVGARTWEGASTNVGGVYTYDWSGGSYVARGSVLEVSGSGHTNLNFGYAVALSSDGAVLVVGATGSDTGGTDCGAVYTFDVSGSAWTQRGSVLQAADAANSDFFGGGVALSSDGAVLAVGAPQWEGASGTDRGGVYIYDVSGSAWSARGSVITASDAADSDQFGFSVALDSGGTRLFVGARLWEGASGTNRGGAYRFDYSGSWAQTGGVVEASDAADTDLFSMVATDSTGTVLVVGAQQWEGSVTDQGGVYVFDLVPDPSGTLAAGYVPMVAMLAWQPVTGTLAATYQPAAVFATASGHYGVLSAAYSPAVVATGRFVWPIFETISDRMEYGSQIAGAAIFQESIADAMSLSTATGWGVVQRMADTLSLSSSATGTMAISALIQDVLALTATGTGTLAIQIMMADTLAMTGAMTPTMTLQVTMRDGMVLEVLAADGDAQWTCLALNTDNNASTLYDNYAFPHMVQFAGRTFLGGPDGLFTVGGSTDNGAEFHATAGTGLFDMGTSQSKRLLNIYVGHSSDGETYIGTLTGNDRTKRWYKLRPTDGDYQTERTTTAKGVDARYWAIEIDSTEAFEIDSIELLTAVLSRKTHG